MSSKWYKKSTTYISRQPMYLNVWEHCHFSVSSWNIVYEVSFSEVAACTHWKGNAKVVKWIALLFTASSLCAREDWQVVLKLLVELTIKIKLINLLWSYQNSWQHANITYSFLNTMTLEFCEDETFVTKFITQYLINWNIWTYIQQNSVLTICYLWHTIQHFKTISFPWEGLDGFN